MKSSPGLRDRLREPGPVFTGLLLSSDPHTAFDLGSCGLDFVTLDAEHGEFTSNSLRECVEALRDTPAGIVVRIASVDYSEIEKLLQLSVDGVMVSHVDDRLEAEDAIRAIKTHGVASPRTPGTAGGVNDRQVDDVAALLIIESAVGVSNAEAIAGVPGVDALVVGPGDLAADLGVPGQPSHVSVRDGIDTVAAAAERAGLRVATWRTPRTASERDRLLTFCLNDRGLLRDAARRAVSQARREMANLRLDARNDTGARE